MNALQEARSVADRARCWVCDSANCTSWKPGNTPSDSLSPEDLRITSKEYGQTLALLKCSDCGMIFSDAAQLLELEQMYSRMTDDEYVESSDARRVQMAKLLQQALRHFPEAKTLLDVGAGSGFLLVEAKRLGLEGTGVELSHSLCNFGRENFGVELVQGAFPSPQLKSRKFDLVFLVDVIEHVPNPLEVLAAAAEKLSDRGRIIIVTPDVSSLTARLLGKKWWHFRTAHVGYFDQRTINLLARKAGLGVAGRFSPNWYFRISHLLQRLANYLPIIRALAFLSRMPFGRALSNVVIPLNLFDSIGVVLARSGFLAKPSRHRVRLAAHLKIMRMDHWIKNIFVLPGIALGYALLDPIPLAGLAWNSLIGLISICLVASGNYVINEILDAPYDRFHPTKQQRPLSTGEASIPLAYVQWVLLIAIGLGFASLVSRAFLWTTGLLAVMGCIYNIPPLRSKDKPFLDVLSEAVNNPIRLLCGWFIVGERAIVPLSFLLCYWMVGAYLMALKRFAELRLFKSPEEAARYRRSFGYYTTNSLLLSSLFYGCTAMLFLGGVIFRYRLELILAYPLVSAVMTAYLYIALKPDGAAHAPEKLYKEKTLIALVAACALVMGVFTFVDVPWLISTFSSNLGR